MGKLLITMAGLMTKGSCNARYCGKVLEDVKVVEMMPRFFWHQQNSLLWTRIYSLSFSRRFDCQATWKGAREAHKVMPQKERKRWHV